jgi:hypothetical protein
MRNFFKRLRARHYAWATVLAIVGIWWPAFILATPPEFIREGRVDLLVLNVCMAVGLIGGITKISGFLASQQPGRVGVLGVSVELTGLILAFVGPFAYLSTSISVSAYTPERPLVNSAVILAIAIMAMYTYRAIILVPRFRREAHDSSKE